MHKASVDERVWCWRAARMLVVFLSFGVFASSAQAGGFSRQLLPSLWHAYTVTVTSALQAQAMVFGPKFSGGSAAVKTADGGKTWTTVSSFTTSADIDGSFTFISDVPTTWAVGTVGKIYKTTNGGSTWTEQTFTTSVAWKDTYFFTSDIGWVVGAPASGGAIYKTTNGGTNWVVQNPSVSKPFTGVQFITAFIGWVVGANGTILKTTDGGATWVAQASGVTNNLEDISCADASLCFVVGANGTILKTVSGGMSWTKLTAPAGVGYTTFRAVRVVSRGVAYDTAVVDVAGGDGSVGTVITTTNGGTTWTESYHGNFMIKDIDASGTFRVAVGASGYGYVYDDVPPPAPTNLSRTPSVNPTTMAMPAFNWTAVTDNFPLSSFDRMAYEVQFDAGSYVNVGDTTSYTPTSALNDGSHTFSVRAKDPAGNAGTAASLTFTVDTTPPTVSAISPTWAILNVSTLLAVTTAESPAGWNCNLLIDGVDAGAMFVGATSITRGHTFGSVGSYPVQARCTDAAGNVGTGPLTTVVVDTTAPAAATVGAVAPNAATAGTALELFASYTGVVSCNLFVDDVDQGAMTLRNGTASKTYTFTTAGEHRAVAHCRNGAGAESVGAVTTVVVSAAAPTASALTVGSVTPISAVAGAVQTFSVPLVGTHTIASCEWYVDGVNRRTMEVSATTARATYTFATPGTYAVQARCLDSVGNVGLGTLTSVRVTATAGAADTALPSAITSAVAAVPAAVVADGSVVATVTVTVKDASGAVFIGKTVSVVSSRPAVDTITVIAPTTNDLGQATFTIHSSTVGSATLTAVVNGVAVGSVKVLFTPQLAISPVPVSPLPTVVPDVRATPAPTPAPLPAGPVPVGGAARQSLVKLACPPKAPSDHACRVVYYLGADGRRYVFPNARVYSTWYTDFTGVKEVNQEFLSSLLISKNVHYRPGVKLVKFVTVPRVYAVSKNGTLRWIATEEIARALYGDDWAKKVNDIPDVFYADYRFGVDIATATDFNPATEQASVSAIDDNFTP